LPLKIEGIWMLLLNILGHHLQDIPELRFLEGEERFLS
jgi:hypothetical protein